MWIRHLHPLEHDYRLHSNGQPMVDKHYIGQPGVDLDSLW